MSLAVVTELLKAFSRPHPTGLLPRPAQPGIFVLGPFARLHTFAPTKVPFAQQSVVSQEHPSAGAQPLGQIPVQCRPPEREERA
jgi:hypothetical protein